MASITVRDHAGRDRVITTVDDWNAFIDELNRRRDELADQMLAVDPDAAARAEEQSDYLEDTVVPRMQAEAKRVQAMLDADAAVARRRAKSEAIRNRGSSDG